VPPADVLIELSEKLKLFCNFSQTGIFRKFSLYVVKGETVYLKREGAQRMVPFFHVIKGTWQRGGFSGVFAEMGSA
jgi:hypothetical protein